MRQYHAAMHDEQEQLAEEAADRLESRTINAVVVSFYSSMDFQKLKETTKKVRRNVLDAFRELHGTKRVATLTPAHVPAIIAAKSNFPGAANNLLKVLRVLLRHAIDMGLIVDNPSRNVRKFAVKSQGFYSWNESDVAAFEACHADNPRAILALLLLLHTGHRRSDLVRLGWQHMTGDLLRVRQDKTSVELKIPLHPRLAEALAAMPRTNLTFLLTEAVAPFTAAGFGNWFRFCSAKIPSNYLKRLAHPTGSRQIRDFSSLTCPAHQKVSLILLG